MGGRNKAGEPETLDVELTLGDILSIVGPTGAGKSRLLEDIECLACGDTPTGRRVLVNGEVPSDDQRFAVDRRVVAQLSQNMSFVLDVSVEQFISLHTESRMLSGIEELVSKVYATALQLTGEPFARETPVTSLSGGQSRALMIADVACLSRSPIVLIDEIENAGVNRDEAMALLVKHDKIVLLVTHDPELALIAPRRLVIQGGGMHALLERSRVEELTRGRLRAHSSLTEGLRRSMRQGGVLRWG